MTKKKETAVKEYTALTRLTNDKTKQVFEAGDIVKDGDFSPSVLSNWLEIGAIREVG